MNSMTYDVWLAEVAELLDVGPADVEEAFSFTREMLYDSGVSPKEAADLIRLNV